MGYCATGYGTIKIKADLTMEELAKLYPAGSEPGILCLAGMDAQVSCVEDLVNAIVDSDEGFEQICFEEYESTETEHVLSFSHKEKYHSDLVEETLRLFAPITIEGEIDFEGDDGEIWCYHYEKGQFVEYSGHAQFESDDPECSNTHCAYCGQGRCHAAAARNENYDLLDIDKSTNMVKTCKCFVPVIATDDLNLIASSLGELADQYQECSFRMNAIPRLRKIAAAILATIPDGEQRSSAMVKLSFYNCICLLQDCVEAGMIQRDPNDQNHILVYRSGGDEFNEGWYSVNLFSTAHELEDDEESQAFILEEYQKKTGKEFARRAI